MRLVRMDGRLGVWLSNSGVEVYVVFKAGWSFSGVQ